MLAVAYVKGELVERLALRLGSVVNVRREPPTRAGDFTGTDRSMHLAAYPLPATVTTTVTEVGAGYVYLDLEATLPVLCRAEAVTASATTADIDNELEGIVTAVLAVVAADPTLGLAPGDDDTITSLFVTCAGWDQPPYLFDEDTGRWAGQVTVNLDISAAVQHPTT